MANELVDRLARRKLDPALALVVEEGAGAARRQRETFVGRLDCTSQPRLRLFAVKTRKRGEDRAGGAIACIDQNAQTGVQERSLGRFEQTLTRDRGRNET